MVEVEYGGAREDFFLRKRREEGEDGGDYFLDFVGE